MEPVFYGVHGLHRLPGIRNLASCTAMLCGYSRIIPTCIIPTRIIVNLWSWLAPKDYLHSLSKGEYNVASVSAEDCPTSEAAMND